jgi:hypothetical protein
MNFKFLFIYVRRKNTRIIIVYFADNEASVMVYLASTLFDTWMQSLPNVNDWNWSVKCLYCWLFQNLA